MSALRSALASVPPPIILMHALKYVLEQNDRRRLDRSARQYCHQSHRARTRQEGRIGLDSPQNHLVLSCTESQSEPLFAEIKDLTGVIKGEHLLAEIKSVVACRSPLRNVPPAPVEPLNVSTIIKGEHLFAETGGKREHLFAETGGKGEHLFAATDRRSGTLIGLEISVRPYQRAEQIHCDGPIRVYGGISEPAAPKHQKFWAPRWAKAGVDHTTHPNGGSRG